MKQWSQNGKFKPLPFGLFQHSIALLERLSGWLVHSSRRVDGEAGGKGGQNEPLLWIWFDGVRETKFLINRKILTAF